MTSELHVGIDVCKRWLDVHVHEKGEHRRIGNDAEVVLELLKWMKEIQPERIVFEATGGYERRVAKALREGGCAVAVVNPIRVRKLAAAFGIWAKTDKIDAKVIANFTKVVRPAVNGHQTPLEEQLAAYVERRRQLLATLSAEKNRLSTCPDCVKDGIDEHIAWLAGKIESLETEIQKMISQQPD